MNRPLKPSTLLPFVGQRGARALFLIFAVSWLAAGPHVHAQAAGGRPSEKARLQMEILRQEQASLTPAQKKIHTQLLHAARQAATGTAVAGVPSLHPNVALEADGRVKVKIKADVTEELLGVIKAQGGTVTASFPQYRAIYATLPLSSLETVAAQSTVESIDTPPKANYNNGTHKKTSAVQTDAAHDWIAQTQGFKTLVAQTANNDPEGDVTHGADKVRAQYGATGAGVKVGVISNSIDDPQGDYQNALLNGYIASNLTVLPGQAGPSTADGEGLAMCEVVQRIVPGAQLYFGTASSSTGGGESANEEQTATNINTMAADGCQIIIDDIAFSDESPFQDSGPVAQAVDGVSAQGILYFSAAANYGNLDSKISSVYEADFKQGVDAGYLDFNPGADNGDDELNLVQTTGTNPDGSLQTIDVYLFWAEPTGNAASQYNLYEYDQDGDVIQSATSSTKDPVQYLNGVTSGDSIAVQMASGSARFLHLDLAAQNSTLGYATAGRVRGHNSASAANAFSVAATPANTAHGDGEPIGPYPSLFSSTNQVEIFSDDGPRRIFFNNDGTAITPGNFSSTGGRVLAKPDFTAADGVTTSVETVGKEQPFFGTSCAAPHAGALAALLLSYRPTLTPAQIGAALRGGAVQITSPGAGDRDAGAGILLAPNIFQAVNTPPSIISFSPANGPAGTLVTISGINLNTTVGVSFNGLPAAFTVTSGTVITATVPAGNVTGPITILTAGGTGTSATNFTLTASVATPVISSPATASGQVDSTFTYQITATNGPTSFNAAVLPAGLSVNPASGVITGVPSVSGVFPVTLTAANTAGGAGTAALTLTILPAPPVISSAANLPAQVGVPFSYQITASNAPTAYGATGLPPGLAVDPNTGVISGTPTTAGAFAVTLAASNGGGLGSLAVTISVVFAPPAITSVTSAVAQVSVAFSYQTTATNNPTSFAANNLPPGLVIDPTTGIISGTPTVSGDYAVTLSAGNTGGIGTATLNLNVAAPPLPIITVMATTPAAHLGDGSVGVFTFTRAGGDLTSKIVILYKVKGSAKNGTDYETVTLKAKIKPNHLSGSLAIIPEGDLDGEASKKVKLVVLPSSEYTLGGVITAAVKIIGD